MNAILNYNSFTLGMDIDDLIKLKEKMINLKRHDFYLMFIFFIKYLKKLPLTKSKSEIYCYEARLPYMMYEVTSVSLLKTIHKTNPLLYAQNQTARKLYTNNRLLLPATQQNRLLRLKTTRYRIFLISMFCSLNIVIIPGLAK